MRRVRHRGVAMLLVLISLGMATIIATSYLSSRDNSSVIGASVYDAAVARWAADSGVELTVAILETQSDWRTAHTDGVLLADLPLAGGTVTVELLDLETLEPPDDNTRAVEITAVGNSNGHRQMATAEAYVNSDGTNLIDVDLSEFASFAVLNIDLHDDAIITAWPMSPAQHLAEGIALGTQGTGMGTVTLNGDGAIVNGTVYTGPGASASLVLNSNSPEVEQVGLGDQIPVPSAPPTGVLTPDEDLLVYLDYKPTGLTMLVTDQRWNDIQAQPGAYIGTKGNVRLVSEDDLELKAGTVMVIEGNTEIVVFDDLILDPTSYIEVKPGSTLTIYVGHDVTIDDAYIGDLRTAEERAAPDTTGYEGYFNPERIKIYGLDGANLWDIRHLSLVQGTIYAPTAEVKMYDDSALYGRITAAKLEMRNFSALFYDPALNNNYGYSNPDSNVFSGGTSSILPEIKAITDLGGSTLVTLAGDTGLAVAADDQVYGTKTVDIVTAPPGEPTPRTVLVTYNVTSFGSYIGHWETPVGTGGTGDSFKITKPKQTLEMLSP